MTKKNLKMNHADTVSGLSGGDYNTPVKQFPKYCLDLKIQISLSMHHDHLMYTQGILL